jgi:hypothetical protein
MALHEPRHSRVLRLIPAEFVSGQAKYVTACWVRLMTTSSIFDLKQQCSVKGDVDVSLRSLEIQIFLGYILHMRFGV